MKTEDLILVPLIIGEASGVFAGFCPSWFTVSSPFFHEQESKSGNIKRIRWGEVAATVIVVATGVALTASTKSPIPFWISVATCGVFVGGYEYMIAHPAAKDDAGPGLPANVPTAIQWNRTR
jgi:hypothetical protein